MNEDTYKGESLQKKHARYLTHVLNQAWVGSTKYAGCFEKGMHAFLCSREGGDIGVLHALGVPFDNMLAIDRCREALDTCIKKWGWTAADPSEGSTPHFVLCEGADVELAGVEACLRSHKNPGHVRREMGTGRAIDCPEEKATGSCWTKRWAMRSKHPYVASAFWDFCGHIDKEIVTTIADTWCRLSVGSVLAVAVLKGREKKQPIQRSPLAPFANRKMRRTQKSTLGKGNSLLAEMMRGRMAWDSARVIREFESEHGRAPAFARWRLIHDVLVMADAWRETVPEPIAIVEYQSLTKEGKGVPMLIVSFAKRWSRDRHDISVEPIRTRLTQEDSLRWRNKILIEHDNKTAALILNVVPSTASAWRAHATRGTYTRKEVAA